MNYEEKLNKQTIDESVQKYLLLSAICPYKLGEVTSVSVTVYTSAIGTSYCIKKKMKLNYSKLI